MDYRELIAGALSQIKREETLIRIYKFIVRLWRNGG